MRHFIVINLHDEQESFTEVEKMLIDFTSSQSRWIRKNPTSRPTGPYCGSWHQASGLPHRSFLSNNTTCYVSSGVQCIKRSAVGLLHSLIFEAKIPSNCRVGHGRSRPLQILQTMPKDPEGFKGGRPRCDSFRPHSRLIPSSWYTS